jgi:hypothetical protein
VLSSYLSDAVGGAAGAINRQQQRLAACRLLQRRPHHLQHGGGSSGGGGTGSGGVVGSSTLATAKPRGRWRQLQLRQLRWISCTTPNAAGFVTRVRVSRSTGAAPARSAITAGHGASVSITIATCTGVRDCRGPTAS